MKNGDSTTDSTTIKKNKPKMHIIMCCLEFAILKGVGVPLFMVIFFQLVNCISLKQNAVKTVLITLIIWIGLYVLTGGANIQDISNDIVIACFGFTLGTYIIMK